MRVVGRRVVREGEESGRGSSQKRATRESVSKREVFEGEATDGESDETSDDSKRNAAGREREEGEKEQRGRRRCQVHHSIPSLTASNRRSEELAAQSKSDSYRVDSP